MQFKRKLYRRGSSYETTIPKPLLFSIDEKKKYHIIFNYDASQNKWFLSFEERKPKQITDNSDKPDKSKRNEKR